MLNFLLKPISRNHQVLIQKRCFPNSKLKSASFACSSDSFPISDFLIFLILFASYFKSLINNIMKGGKVNEFADKNIEEDVLNATFDSLD